MANVSIPPVEVPIKRNSDIPLRRFHISYIVDGITRTACFYEEDQDHAIKEAIDLVPDIHTNGNNIIEVLEK